MANVAHAARRAEAETVVTVEATKALMVALTVVTKVLAAMEAEMDEARTAHAVTAEVTTHRLTLRRETAEVIATARMAGGAMAEAWAQATAVTKAVTEEGARAAADTEAMVARAMEVKREAAMAGVNAEKMTTEVKTREIAKDPAAILTTVMTTAETTGEVTMKVVDNDAGTAGGGDDARSDNEVEARWRRRGRRMWRQWSQRRRRRR